MVKRYFAKDIEAKWQKRWKEDQLFSPDLDKAPQPYYSLMMFPYPSAEGMHVGNMYAFTGSDVFSRFKRLQGYDVFEPIGLDGFGIHGENYALKINEHPMEVSKRTEKHFYEQFSMIGNAYDWTRTVDTYKPEYYKWTQWVFLQLYKQGLAYRKKAEVNWCPSCRTVLADEQVVSGECERCSTQVIKKELEQWFLKITNYAEKLLANIDKLDWSEKVKIAQRNWIGKSEGALIKFGGLEVFTTRPDTLLGATFLVISPEHPLLTELANSKLKTLALRSRQNSKLEEVMDYVATAKNKSELERKENKNKTGVFTGVYVKNPMTGEDIPVWVADYVLMGYGTGAIMAVPAHDQRDFDFAKKYGLEIKTVIQPHQTRFDSRRARRARFACEASLDARRARRASPVEAGEAYEGDGVLINSGEFNGLSSDRAKEKITKYLTEHHLGHKQVQFHLRDWLISRQRYWGPPIPIVYCDKCGVVPVPEKDLPVKLPYLQNFRPLGTGESPLASDPDFVNVKCPKCNGPARRETDVSDNFLDSSLYFFRYLTTDKEDEFFDKRRTEKWLPVDTYIGGAEHSVLHLLYSRFITMAFKDMGFIGFEEPFTKFRAHGLIIAEGAKMSKSKGNVVNPDQYINEWGADTLRTYLMFMGPFTEGGDFRGEAISGIYRFLTRIWDLVQSFEEREATVAEQRIFHKTVKKSGQDLENLHYNTTISSLMELLNFLSRQKTASRETIKGLVIMLSPFAPFITEELWEMLGEKYSVHQQLWPKTEEKHLQEDKATVAVQVNGKVRDVLVIQKDMGSNREVVEKMARELPKVAKFLEGKCTRKVIYVPVKIVNFVID